MVKRALADTAALRARLGRHLRALRVGSGLTLQWIADTVGVTISTVTAWERGTCMPSLDRFPLLADTLGVTVLSLLRVALNDDLREADGGTVHWIYD